MSDIDQKNILPHGHRRRVVKPERYNEQVWLSDEEEEEDIDRWVLEGSSAEEEDDDLDDLVQFSLLQEYIKGKYD